MRKVCFGCGHNHKAIALDRKVDSEKYDMYIEWKYRVGSKGSRELCWDCFYRNYGLGKSKV